jgi:hypothetical protein
VDTGARAPGPLDIGTEITPQRADLAERSARCEATLHDGHRWRWRTLAENRQPITIAVGAGALAATVAAAVGFNDFGWLTGLLGLAVLVNMIVFGIARATRRFGWLGLSVFLSVLLFGGAVVGARSMRSPELQPVALIRKGDNVGLCGIYITETDKRVYLGRIQMKPDGSGIEPSTGRMFWVPDSDVDMMKVGTLQPLAQANANAARLLEELYADRAEDPGIAVKPQTSTAVKTLNGTTTTTTVTETPPHPRQQASPRPRPQSTANVCTSATLSTQLPKTSPKPQPPVDDSPRDP